MFQGNVVPLSFIPSLLSKIVHLKCWIWNIYIYKKTLFTAPYFLQPAIFQKCAHFTRLRFLLIYLSIHFFLLFAALAAPIKERGRGKKSCYTIKMKPATCRLIEVCSLHVCVKCVDGERHRGAAGSGGPREAREGKQSTQCQLLADPR